MAFIMPIHRITVNNVALLLCIILQQGCVDTTVLSYQPVTFALDDKNELHVSTYPSGFPTQTDSVPFLYKALRTPESVYFQVFVRDKIRKAGKNPHVDSITIHSFSYHFPGQAPVELMSNYEDYFWMQGMPEDNPGGDPPVPYDDHWYLQVQISLTVNGQRYEFEETVHADKQRYIRPLILYALE